MATIELYANKINSMPGLVTGIRNETNGLKSELMTLRTKVQSINRNICNVDDVISSITASTQTQEDKIDVLNNLAEDIQQFASEAERTDRNVADTVNQNKEDFYEKYSYLKPFWEKNLFEQMADVGGFLLESAAEWCKEHWKLVVAVVLVAVAVVVLVALAGATGPFAALALMTAKSVITQTIAGALIGGVISVLTGGSFWEGLENGAFDGAISGLISGIFMGGIVAKGAQKMSGGIYELAAGPAKPFNELGKVGVIDRFMSSWVVTGKAKPMIGLGRTMFYDGVSDAGAAFLGDVLDIGFKGKNISPFEVMIDTGFAAILGSSSPILFRNLPDIKMPKITKGNGSWRHVWASQSTRSLRYGTNIRFKTYLKGIGKAAVENAWDLSNNISKSAINEWSKSWNLQPQH